MCSSVKWTIHRDVTAKKKQRLISSDDEHLLTYGNKYEKDALSRQAQHFHIHNLVRPPLQ